MSTTLVGLFDDYGQAREACSKLQAAGLDEQSIRLNGDASDSTTAPVEAPREQTQEPGVIRRFFSQLFGTADEGGVTTYAEAVQRGSSVVTVALADDARVDEVKDILMACGAVEVEDRARQWKVSDEPTLPMDEAADRDDARGVPRTVAYGDMQNGGALVYRPATPYAGPERRVRNDPSYRGSERRLAA